MSDYVLSIYFGFHDSNIALANQERVLLHLEAERYFRRKHTRVTADEMHELIDAAFNHLGISINDISTVYLAKWNNLFGDGPLTLFGKIFNPILTGHHENHIGTGNPSGYDSAVVICADGGSEDNTTKVYLKKNRSVQLLDDLDKTPMTGKFYGTMTQMIVEPRFGRAHDTAPGKVMGLASMGEYSEEFAELIERYKEEINKLHFEGCEHLLDFFGLSHSYDRVWEDKKRRDLAFTTQKYWEDLFVRQLKKYRHLSDNLILTGGCAYNVNLNSRIIREEVFERVYVSPVSGDCGQSIGAILYHHPSMKCNFPFLGRSFGEMQEVPDSLARDLFSHKIIAWYQGAAESGPRALGHRSFFGLPDSIDMRIRLSQGIKKREPYRPVAPVVPEEYLGEFFDTRVLSPFMTFAPPVKEITKKLAPAVVHFDGSSRVQTISQTENPFLHQLLLKVGDVTGVPILMNSSFNVAQVPIVDTPQDAVKMFLESGADSLYVNGKRYG